MKLYQAIFPLLLFSGLYPVAQDLNKGLIKQTDWQKFLSRNDLVWGNALPDSWDKGAFLGNGTLGTIFWADQKGALHFEVSRGDLYDHRNDPYRKAVLYSNNRLPNGHFELVLGNGKISGNMRLDLWNAEARALVSNGNDRFGIRCFTAADRNVIILEVDGPENHHLQWFPDTAKTTRNGAPKDYRPYPPQRMVRVKDVSVSIQDMPEDVLYKTNGKGAAAYATAWLKQSFQGKSIYYISMGYSCPGAYAWKDAVELVKKARKVGFHELEKIHRNWWHTYYSKSFLSVPDPAIESFYWIQMYKMASASRSNGPVLDLMGPWFRPTGWPAIWWNLNIQLAYWPYYMSNHLEEAVPLANVLWNQRKNLAKNAAPYQNDSYAIGRASAPDLLSPVGGEVGNLPWVMQNLWMYYRSGMNDRYLKKQLFPLMKGAFKYLYHIAVKQADGTLGLPNTASPEYTDAVENSSYTLACFRWLASTLVQANTRLKANDPVIKECREVLDHLAAYEVDSATGFMVGKGLPFVRSHRHWSHLFMIYPFYEYTWQNPLQKPLIEKSLKNWISMPKAFAGYSWLGASSISAAGGRGDEALGFLKTFLKTAPLPNTLYREGFPVIETPLAFARSLQELMMTSYGTIINIFPGVPSTWPEVSFADFRAEGAFLVSAKRQAGRTSYVEIKSLAGEPCKMNTGMNGNIKIAGKYNSFKDLGHGIVEIVIPKGAAVILYDSESLPDTTLSPVVQTGRYGPWGEAKAIR